MKFYPLPAALAVSSIISGAFASCGPQDKIAAIKKEIKTIRSHDINDGLAIPYAPEAYRVFTITPNETKPISVFVPAGINALTTRAIILVLGTVLDAGVPEGSDRYTVNPNGTVTVDYIQTDGIALQEVDVREIHSFNEKCQIIGITGYVRGNLEQFLGNVNLPTLLDQLTGGLKLGSLVAGLLGVI